MLQEPGTCEWGPGTCEWGLNLLLLGGQGKGWAPKAGFELNTSLAHVSGGRSVRGCWAVTDYQQHMGCWCSGVGLLQNTSRNPWKKSSHRRPTSSQQLHSHPE